MEISLAPIGEILIDQELISRDDLERALTYQQQIGGKIGAILVRIGAISEEKLLAALSLQLGLPVFSTEDFSLEIENLLAAIEMSGLAIDWWLDRAAIIWKDHEKGFCVAARDPLEPSFQETLLNAHPKTSFNWFLILSNDLERVLELLEQANHSKDVTLDKSDVAHLRELAQEAPVVELVSNMLSQAFGENASDIHIEPGEKVFRIRYRIDGVLQTRFSLPRERYDAIASRIKLISGMDIAERRLPQDGRLSQRLSGQEIDLRISALPGAWGESIVMRLLPKERQQFKLEFLGLDQQDLTRYRRFLNEPHGIVLVTGPTGSGKSTTLYASLSEINNGKTKIITVENPIEYHLQGISQTQVHSEIGLSFSSILRSILRQDPDIIMIGEIRDFDTAEVAVQAALTGHMVFSTLHTNDALSAFTRLIDMGIEPFLVSASVRAVMAQRLIRKLCPHCAIPHPPQKEIIREVLAFAPHLKSEEAKWYQAVGCKNCQGIGYKGRIGIYELITVTPALQEGIVERRPLAQLMNLAAPQAAHSLRQDGLIKAYHGLTSVDEVLRVTGLTSVAAG
jgi:general secretion pathway protein E